MEVSLPNHFFFFASWEVWVFTEMHLVWTVLVYQPFVARTAVLLLLRGFTGKKDIWILKTVAQW